MKIVKIIGLRNTDVTGFSSKVGSSTFNNLLVEKLLTGVIISFCKVSWESISSILVMGTSYAEDISRSNKMAVFCWGMLICYVTEARLKGPWWICFSGLFALLLWLFLFVWSSELLSFFCRYFWRLYEIGLCLKGPSPTMDVAVLG